MTTTEAKSEPLSVSQVEAARLLGVTDRTIRNWERRGLVAGHRVGGTGKRLYPFAKLKALVTGEDHHGVAAAH